MFSQLVDILKGQMTMSRLKNADSETFSRLRMSTSIDVLRVFISRRVDILKHQLAAKLTKS